MLDNVASPAVRQKRSKLAPTSCQASSMFAAGTRAVNVVGFFMALLSFRGFDASSLAAQGEQRLPLIFNIQRGNASPCATAFLYKAQALASLLAVPNIPWSASFRPLAGKKAWVRVLPR